MLALSLEETAADSLARSVKFLEESKTDNLALKWFIIAFHHSVYSFMLVALKDTAQDGIWKGKKRFLRDATGTIDIFHPSNRLIDFLFAYNAIKKPERMKRYVNSIHFVSEQKHDDAMVFLNDELRNQMIHFRPATWAIGRKYLAQCMPVLDVLKFLLFKSNLVFFFEEGAKDVIKQTVTRLEELLEIENSQPWLA